MLQTYSMLLISNQLRFYVNVWKIKTFKTNQNIVLIRSSIFILWNLFSHQTLREFLNTVEMKKQTIYLIQLMWWIVYLQLWVNTCTDYNIPILDYLGFRKKQLWSKVTISPKLPNECRQIRQLISYKKWFILDREESYDRSNR